MQNHTTEQVVETKNTPITKNSKQQVISLIILILLTAAIYIGSASSPSLQDDADAAHAEAAREMVERNDWVTLHINGIRYLEKAPLMYWAVALSYKLFGFTEFATRLPLTIAMLGLVICTYFFGNWLKGERAGFYSGLAMSVGLGSYLFTRILIPEVILSFFITLSFFIFLKIYYEELDSKWYYAFYIGMAAAVLTKGLIGIVFPCGILFLFILFTGGWSRIGQMRIVSGVLLFLLITAPWHILAGIYNANGPNGKGFFWFYFVNEHFLRYLGKRYPMDYDKVPLLSFWLFHLIWLFPFSIFLPIAITQSKFLFKLNKQTEQLHLFIWIWFLFIIGFFSFSTRQEYYTFPAFPALALIIGITLQKAEQKNRAFVLVCQGILAGLGFIAAGVLGYFLWISRNVSSVVDISQVLTQNPENYKLSLGHMSDLTVEAFATLRIPAAGAALSLSIGFIMALVFRVKKKSLETAITMALATAGFIYFAHSALIVFDSYLSSKALAIEIRKRISSEDIVVINGDFGRGSTLRYYLARKILLLNGRVTGMEFGSHYPDAPQIFIDNTTINHLWNSEKRIFLFTPDEKYNDLKEHLIGPTFKIATKGEKTIYSNQP